LFGEAHVRMHAVQGNLDNPSSELDQADWSDFDVAVISMALHHVPHPVKMLSQLRERLRTGGCLVVVEWYEEGDAPDATSGSDKLDRDDMIIVNGGEKIWAGFTPHGLSMLLQQAGFAHVNVKKPDVSFSIPESVSGPMSGQSRKLMFVKGVNGPSSAS
jgi:SAM-dependent methyltransferase